MSCLRIGSQTEVNYAIGSSINPLLNILSNHKIGKNFSENLTAFDSLEEVFRYLALFVFHRFPLPKVHLVLSCHRQNADLEKAWKYS